MSTYISVFVKGLGVGGGTLRFLNESLTFTGPEAYQATAANGRWDLTRRLKG